LRADFAEVVFFIQAPASSLGFLQQAGLTVVPLPTATLAQEATHILPALLRATDVLVLDGYGFTFAYQTLVRPLVARLVCLDDLHAFPFAADLVLNPAGGLNWADYDLRMPHARVLAGPSYAPLRADFQYTNNQDIPTPTSVVLLCLGGADPHQLTQTTATALLALPDVAQVHAVVGSAFAGWELLQAWAASHPGRLHLHRALSATELANLMRQCGAAVLSPSTTSYEYCAAGGGLLLLLPTADNQHDLAHFLREKGMALPYTTAANVLTASEAPRLASQLRQAQRRHFDGRAPQRLRQEFAALRLPPAPLRLRLVQPTDSGQLLTWANDSETRRQSFDPRPISTHQHEAWLASQLAQAERCLLLLAEATDSGEAAGIIRFVVTSEDAGGPTATLSYTLAPAYRGRGWAAPLLLAGTRAVLARFPSVRQVVGEVKPTNEASVRAFRRAGYQLLAERSPSAGLTFVWTAAPAA